MLDFRAYLTLIGIAVLFVWLSDTYPAYWPVFAIGFVITELIAVFVLLIRAFATPGRLIRHKKFDKAIKLCRKLLKRKMKPLVINVVKVYLALALLGRNRSEDNAEANELLGVIDAEILPGKVSNFMKIAQATTKIRSEDYDAAFAALSEIEFDRITPYYLIRTFYLFSVVFTEQNRDLERAFNYATKAYQLEPEEKLYAAQLGISQLLFKENPGVAHELLSKSLGETKTLGTWESERAFYYIKEAENQLGDSEPKLQMSEASEAAHYSRLIKNSGSGGTQAVH